MGVVLGEISVNIRADTNRFNSDLNNANNQGNRFSTNFGNIMSGLGRHISKVGSDLTKYITGPLSLVSAASVKLGSDFESSLQKIVGLVGVSQKQVDQWGKDILKIAPDLGKAPAELADALFFVTSAGIKGAKAMDVLEMSAKASSAGLGDTKTIADLVTSAMNAYGQENLSAAEATDIVAMAVRQGKAEASELASTMGQVLPLASEMGVSFDQVAAAQAAMTRTGTDASEASTQLKSIMSGLLKPSKQAEEQLQKMGTSASKMRKQIREEGLLSALTDLRKKTNKYGEEAMAKVFPNIRGLMGVLDLMGSNAEENAKIFDEVSDSSGTMEEAFKSSSKTLDFKWNKALSQAKVMAITLFDALKARLIPKIEMLTAVIAKITNRFASMSPEMQDTIINFALMAAAIGPGAIVLGGIITKIGTAFTFVSGVVTTASTIISTLMTPAISALIAPIAAVIAIIAGLVASFVYLYKTNEDFRNKVMAVWETLQSVAKVIFNEIKKTVEFVFKAIQDFWEKHGDKIIAVAEFIWNTILDIINAALKIIKDIIKFICSIIRGDWKSAWDAIKGIIGSALEVIDKLLGNLKEFIIKAFIYIKDKAIEKVKGLLKGLKDKFDSLVEAGKKLVKSIISGIKQKFVDIKNAGVNIGKKIVNAVTSIDYVQVGKDIIGGLINGILSMNPMLDSTTEGVAYRVSSKLPHSPAKEGPLKNLDKLDFYNPIKKSILSAKNRLDMPALKLVGGLIGDIPKDFNIPNLNGNGIGVNSKNITLSGPFNFYGVQDTYQLMKELQSTIKRYGGS
jgi:TP901 family phage tail tape measure protein